MDYNGEEFVKFQKVRLAHGSVAYVCTLLRALYSNKYRQVSFYVCSKLREEKMMRERTTL